MVKIKFDLSGVDMKNIVITGSSRGIGYCMAKEFLKAGCNVTISGRSEKSFELAKHELEEYESKIIYIICNVTNREEIEKLWAVCKEKWGKIDYWINNAGRNAPHELLYETETAYVDAIINTNIKGMIYGSQIAAKNMIAQGDGQIWNMEGLGSNNMIQPKTILYGTTKHALTYFTKGLAKELDGTPVFAGRLSPGMMLTDFIIKTCDGQDSPVLKDKSFIKIFNILADRPETVAEYFIPKMLENKKNNAQIAWLTTPKIIWRFLTGGFKKRFLLTEKDCK